MRWSPAPCPRPVSYTHLKIIEDHKKLLEAIRSRDKKLAAETMDLHLNRWMLNEQMFRDQYPAYFK